ECTVLPFAARRGNGGAQGAIVVFRDIAERRTAERLRWELSHDPLTGLPNARHLRKRLISEISRLPERGGYSALLTIQLRRDDADASPRGDEMLRTVAQALVGRLREGEVLARGETENFLLLLSGVQIDHLDVLVESFSRHLDGLSYSVGDTRYTLVASIGAE